MVPGVVGRPGMAVWTLLHLFFQVVGSCQLHWGIDNRAMDFSQILAG